MGLVLKVVVLSANLSDREGGKLLLNAIFGLFPRLTHIWADQGYKGAFQQWAQEVLGLEVEVVYPWWRQIERYLPGVYEQLGQGFKVIPRRWVVERTFAWLTFQRRLNRDYELLPVTTECLIYLAMIRLTLRRLAC